MARTVDNNLGDHIISIVMPVPVISHTIRFSSSYNASIRSEFLLIPVVVAEYYSCAAPSGGMGTLPRQGIVHKCVGKG